MAQVNSTAAGIELPGSPGVEPSDDFEPIQPNPPVKNELPTPSPSRRAEPIVQAHVPEEREAPEDRSEEHTSELQSLMRISYAVFSLKKIIHHTSISCTYTPRLHLITFFHS